MTSFMFNQPENTIYQNVFNYVKIYPTFVRVFQYPQPLKTRLPGWELVSGSEISSNSSLTTEFQKELYQKQSLRRTKTTLSDLTLCNEFDLFVTFTFAKNRFDVTECKRKMSRWLQNQQTLHGKFTYLIVPEFHKDRKAIHFHGLLKNYRGGLKNSGIKQNGRDVYNIKSYKAGFSTAVKIDNHAKVSSYIRKYITKDMPQFEGKKRYWCSTGLKRPLVLPNQGEHVLSLPFVHFTTEYETKTLTTFRADVNIQSLFNKRENKWNQLISPNRFEKYELKSANHRKPANLIMSALFDLSTITKSMYS